MAQNIKLGYGPDIKNPKSALHYKGSVTPDGQGGAVNEGQVNGDEGKQGTYHLASNPKIYEIQRGNTFEFVVTGLNNGHLPIVGQYAQQGSPMSAYSDPRATIKFSVKSTSVPHFTQGVHEVRRGNNAIKFAGAATFDSGTLVLTDYIGADSKGILMAWQNLSYNVVTEKVGLATDYKKDCYLIEYSPDWQKVRQWIMHGCWISGISEDTYDTDSDGKRLVTATIQYDKATIDLDMTPYGDMVNSVLN